MELRASCVELTGCDNQGMTENLEGDGQAWTGGQETLFLPLTCGATSGAPLVLSAV